MDDLQMIRASDHDRQEVVDRLRGALEDGRLKMDEFTDRVGLAYQAVTYGDLALLYADLPAVGSTTEREAAASALAPPARLRRQGVLAGLPTTLKVLWTIWLTAVLVNVAVWALVCGTSARLVYPWPLWVAGPYGAALLPCRPGAGRSGAVVCLPGGACHRCRADSAFRRCRVRPCPKRLCEACLTGVRGLSVLNRTVMGTSSGNAVVVASRS
jgi:DUF1707 SHOCT-like domain